MDPIEFVYQFFQFLRLSLEHELKFLIHFYMLVYFDFSYYYLLHLIPMALSNPNILQINMMEDPCILDSLISSMIYLQGQLQRQFLNLKAQPYFDFFYLISMLVMHNLFYYNMLKLFYKLERNICKLMYLFDLQMILLFLEFNYSLDIYFVSLPCQVFQISTRFLNH